jgi:D-alanyl-D-alanine dipeptidase
VAVGSVSEEQRRIYKVTLSANEAGRKRVAPNVACEEVDRAARGVIDRAGYGQYFLHRTGHGLGLEIHEPPFMVEGYTLPLKPGMTFTVEPGVYLAGESGVRIEDDVVVTQDGGESMTSFTRELLVL